MWIFVKLLLLAVLVDSGRISANEPLVVYVQGEEDAKIDQSATDELYNVKKVADFQSILKLMMKKLQLKKTDQHQIENALRSSIKNRCSELQSCQKVCRKSRVGKVQCKEECKRDIDEDDLCNDDEEVKEDECQADTPAEKKDEECKASVEKETKVEDECADVETEKVDECKKRAQFRSRKSKTKKSKNKKRLFRSS